MMLSTLEFTRVPQSVCPHCGHRVDTKPRTFWSEAGLGILATIVSALMLFPLGIITWKSCTDFYPTESRTRSSSNGSRTGQGTRSQIVEPSPDFLGEAVPIKASDYTAMWLFIFR